ncbi:MAG: hypothetical protein GXO87_01040 [Chlorobi bacterium]|nr:hypothetical protein [Chlorobiota bacterium]
MSLYQCHTGLNITGDRLQLVEIEYKDEGLILSNIGEEYFDEYPDPFGKETKFNSLLQKAFDEIILRKPLKSNFVSFSLPFYFFKILELPFDHSLIKTDLIDQFKWELATLYPHEKESEFLTQHIDLSGCKEMGNNNAILISAQKKQLKIIHKFCVRNNLQLKFADYTHIAANNLIQLVGNNERGNNFVSLHISDRYYSFSYNCDNIPVFFDIKRLGSIVEIIDSVSASFEKVKKRSLPIDSLGAYFLSGADVSETLAGQLKQNFETDFHLLNPAGEAIIIDEKIKDSFDKNEFHTFAAPAGIALRLI